MDTITLVGSIALLFCAVVLIDNHFWWRRVLRSFGVKRRR